MLISKEYRALNKQLHAENPSFGNDNFGWSKYALDLAEKNGYQTVLDYGAGKGRLAKLFAEHGRVVQEYDPAIEGKDAAPEPAELVTCTDVLEHIEPEHINAVLRDLRRVTQKRLFLTIYTKPAGKTLPDGRNAHILQKPGSWWHKKLIEHFQILIWEERGAVIAAELVAKKHTGMIRPKERRPMTPEVMAYLGNIRDQINAASDAFSQITTMRMWEGIDDEPADLQGAYDVIHHLDDVDSALRLLAQNSLKCTFCAVRISDRHSEWDWKRLFERRFRIAQWQIVEDNILVIGSPMVNVQGVCAVGAVGTDERWGQVEVASKRIKARIEPAAPHGRTAILACYGPSLVDTIESIKEAARDPNTDVISVSGAHDFLLSHGVVPKYHVECDPRPHKSDNLEKPHPDVTYLVASVCHERYFEKLEGADIRLWHVSTADHIVKLLQDMGENPKHVISGGGSVGLRSIPLLYALGYRTLHIHAMDCSFKVDEDTKRIVQENSALGKLTNPEDLGASQWAGKHAGKKQDMAAVRCDEDIYISSPVLLTYATNFFETVQKVSDLNVRLYGDGLLQATCRYYERQELALMERIEQGEPLQAA